MLAELYSNQGNLEAMSSVVQKAGLVSSPEDTNQYTLDELYANGAAKRDAMDAYNEELDNYDDSILKAVYGSFRHSTAFGALTEQAIENVNQDFDPEFNIVDSIDEIKLNGYSKEELEVLSKGRNNEHFASLVEKVNDYKDHKMNLQALGVPLAMASQLLAEVANPINYIPFIGQGAAATLTVKTVLAGAAIQGAFNAGEEALISTVYKDRSTVDYAASFALGVALSGTINAARLGLDRKRITQAATDAKQTKIYAESMLKDKADEGVATAKAGPPPERDYTDSSALRDKDGVLNPEVADDMRAKGYDPDNEVDNWVHRYDTQGLIPRVQKVVQETLKLAGFSQTLAGSPNKHTRALNRVLFEHGEGGTGVHKEHTATLEAHMQHNFVYAKYAKRYEEAKALFTQSGKDTGLTMNDFNTIAFKYIDGGENWKDPRLTEDMIKTLEDFQGVYNTAIGEVTEIAHKAGVSEFKDWQGIDNFLFRRHDPEALYKLTQEFGDDGKAIKELYRKSITNGGWRHYSDKIIQKAGDKYDATVKVWKAKGSKGPEPAKPGYDPKDVEADIEQIANALYNRMINRATTTTADANLLSSANQSILLDTLDDLGLSEAKMKHFKAMLRESGRDVKGDPSKARIQMDMTTTIDINGRTLSMTDLLDTDLSQGFASVGRYWLGRAAMARKGDHLASVADIQKTLNHAAKEGLKAGVDKKVNNQETKIMEQGIRMILGQSAERADTTGAKFMRTIRKMAAASSLGRLGIVQAGETGRMVGAVNAAQRIPMIRDLTKGVLTGKFSTASLKGIEDYVIGDVAFRKFLNHPDFRADDFGEKSGKVDQVFDKLGYYLSQASGWHIMHTMQTKGLINTLDQKWYKEVMDGTMKPTQMRDLGVDNILMADLKRNMKAHATKTEGLTGKKTQWEMNIEKWDPKTRRAYGMMLTRKSNNAIQGIMTGETPMWLNTEIGKFLGQFRTFSVAALSKQTTRDYKMIREGDMEGAISMFFNTCTSVMANTAKIGFIAATLPSDERKKYVEKALNPVAMANQTLSYVGALSPLMEAGNLLGDTMFGDKWGEYAGGKIYRGKGLSGMVPGINYINNAYKGVTGITTSALTDAELTKSEYRAMYSTIPFSNNYASDFINNRVITPALFGDK